MIESLYATCAAGALSLIFYFKSRLKALPKDDHALRSWHAARLFRCVFVVISISMAGLSVVTLTPDAYSSKETSSGVGMIQVLK